jgi:hypothetical protein
MKKAVLFLTTSVLMLMISCGDEQPTKVSEYVFDKRNIENDTNWVEITDIDTVENTCYDQFDVIGGVLCMNESEYRNYYDLAQERIYQLKSKLSQQKRDSLGNCYKFNNYTSPDVDFNTHDLILYSMTSGFANWERKLFFNDHDNEYFYLLTIDTSPSNGEYILVFYNDAIKIPKLNNSTKIKFDTIMVRYK